MTGGAFAPVLRPLPLRRRLRGPSAAATSSTSTWLTRLDLPEPETPVTVVKTPSGKSASSWLRLLRVTPAQPQPALGLAGRASVAAAWRAEEMPAGLRLLDLFEPGGRAAVEDVAALLARGRPDVDDPVGMPDHVEIVFDDEQRIARGLQLVERREQRFGVGGMQPADGSSSTYTTPNRLERTCVASRSRWSSPGESVGVLRSSDR